MTKKPQPGQVRAFAQQLSGCQCLSAQQKRTLLGQAVNGDFDGAYRGMETLLRRKDQQQKEAKA